MHDLLNNIMKKENYIIDYVYDWDLLEEKNNYEITKDNSLFNDEEKDKDNSNKANYPTKRNHTFIIINLKNRKLIVLRLIVYFSFFHLIINIFLLFYYYIIFSINNSYCNISYLYK